MGRETAAIAHRLGELLRQSSWHRLDVPARVVTIANAPRLPPASEEVLAASLAFDPARGGTGKSSIEEAAVGIAALFFGVVKAPARRDPSGRGEFVDGARVVWDVKSPRTAPAGASWRLDVPHQLKLVRRDLAQGQSILLNLSGCSPQDAQAVRALLQHALTPAEKARVWVMTVA